MKSIQLILFIVLVLSCGQSLLDKKIEKQNLIINKRVSEADIYNVIDDIISKNKDYKWVTIAGKEQSKMIEICIDRGFLYDDFCYIDFVIKDDAKQTILIINVNSVTAEEDNKWLQRTVNAVVEKEKWGKYSNEIDSSIKLFKKRILAKL